MKILNAANILTLIRLLMIIPLFPLSMHREYYWLALILFWFAMLTDMFDGMVARKYKMITNLGKFMDQITDKLLINAILLIFLWARELPLWFVAIIILRDILVGGVRMFLASKGVVVPANKWGKIKTLLQTILVSTVYLSPYIPVKWFIYVLVYLTAAIAIYSGYTYFLHAVPYLMEKGDE
ncbi:CDP-diacylglycerol--glycerol-3-phosphate 3-phosphatidyltransferase [bacterium 3DAC]|nr:CDP-diacylglycerol--glycerol-3-phosphate 3-phosphatidyltransferase [Dictyoglomota bacterium]UZN23177.1 CDP-diacylglycerol--glycerol-3-phosphate 3-phosphatidyltransferase [bacterium 3DAC]